MKTQEKVFKHEELQSYAELLKSSGLTVYISVWKHSNALPTYFHFTDGVNIGYVECTSWGFRFGTVHKPNKITGTGFGLQSDNDRIGAPTLSHALECFIGYPDWCRAAERSSVVKYKNWDEFAKKSLSKNFLKL